MSGKSINFGDKKIRKSNFYKNKKINSIEDIDVNKILISKKEPYGTKRLPQMTGYARKFDENVKMFFGVNNKQLLKNHNKI